MPRFAQLIPTSLLLLFLLNACKAKPQATASSQTQNTDRATFTELIVKTRPGADAAAVAAELQTLRANIARSTEVSPDAISVSDSACASLKVMRVNLPSSDLKSKSASAMDLAGSTESQLVEWVEYNESFTLEEYFGVQPKVVPNDSALVNGLVWSHDYIKVSGAWNFTKGHKDIVVAVVDSGLNFNHQDLPNQSEWVSPYNYLEGNNEPLDDFGHGSHVSGIILAKADNGFGGAGVCPNCTLMPLRAITWNGGTWLAVAQSICHAVKNSAQVINLSLGAPRGDKAVEVAIKEADEAGVLIVAAAGNTGSRSSLFPAKLKEVLSISNLSQNYNLASTSSYSSHVDLTAPGDGIYSTYAPSPDSFASLSGTSLSAPHVSGVAALLFAQGLELGQPRSAREVRRMIEANTTNIDYLGVSKIRFGKGLLNAEAALSPKAGDIKLQLTLPERVVDTVPTDFYFEMDGWVEGTIKIDIVDPLKVSSTIEIPKGKIIGKYPVTYFQTNAEKPCLPDQSLGPKIDPDYGNLQTYDSTFTVTGITLIPDDTKIERKIEPTNFKVGDPITVTAVHSCIHENVLPTLAIPKISLAIFREDDDEPELILSLDDPAPQALSFFVGIEGHPCTSTEHIWLEIPLGKTEARFPFSCQARIDAASGTSYDMKFSVIHPLLNDKYKLAPDFPTRLSNSINLA